MIHIDINYPNTLYNQLLPLLLRGLNLPDNNIRGNVIDTFLAAAEGDSPETSIVAEHASTLATSMLKNSMVENMPSIVISFCPLFRVLLISASHSA